MEIYNAINQVMAEIGAITKDKKNAQQGFMYRGVDDVMNALQPALIKNKVCVVPEVLEHTREERQTAKGGTLIYSIMKIKHHFIAQDGSEVCSVVVGEGMDSGDKASNKALAIAFKYACFQVFCIPTEEMVDADAETPEQSRKAEPSIAERRNAEIKSLIESTDYSVKDVTAWLARNVGEGKKVKDLTDEQYSALVRDILATK